MRLRSAVLVAAVASMVVWTLGCAKLKEQAAATAGSSLFSRQRLGPKGELRSFAIAENTTISPERFLADHRSELGLGPDDALVADESYPLELRGKSVSATHYRHIYKGVPVEGSGWVLAGDQDRLVLGNSSLVPGLNADVTPKVAVDVARSSAVEEFDEANHLGKGTTGVVREELALVPSTKARDARSFRLAWRFILSDARALSSRTTDIDAATGRVLRASDNARGRANKPQLQNVTLQGNTVFNSNVSFVAEGYDELPPYQLGTLFQQSNPFLPAIDEKCRWAVRRDPSEYTSTGVALPDGGPALFTEVNPDSPPNCDSQTAVQTMWSVEQVFAYWDEVFKWKGIAGKDKGNDKTVTVINDYTYEDNATFDTANSTMVLSANEGDFLDRSFDSVDIVGHELTHGMVETVWGDAPPLSTEAASIEEGLGDIFGVAARAGYPSGRSRNGFTVDWILGDKVRMNRRNLQNPKPNGFPDTYLGQNWVPPAAVPLYDPHQDATVLGYWFYLVVAGKTGTVDDVPNSPDTYTVVPLNAELEPSFLAAVKLVQKTLVMEAGSQGRSFQDFMNDSETVAAADLDAAGQQTIAQAWYAVGFGDKGSQDHSPMTGESGVAPWPVLFQWESNPQDASRWAIEVAQNTDDLLNESGPTFISGFTELDKGVGGKLWAYWSTDLQGNTNYYWRVRSLNGSLRCILGDSVCVGPWSDVWRFQTGGDAQLGASPTDAWGADFEWSPVDGATSYDLEIFDMYEDPNFDNPWIYPVAADPNANGNPHAKIPLLSETNYAWAVITYGPMDPNATGQFDPYLKAPGERQVFKTGPNHHKATASEDDSDAWKYSFRVDAPDGTDYTAYDGTSAHGISIMGSVDAQSPTEDVPLGTFDPLAQHNDTSAKLSLTLTATEKTPYECLEGCLPSSGSGAPTEAPEVGESSISNIAIDWVPTEAVPQPDVVCAYNDPNSAKLTFNVAPDNDANTFYDVTIIPKGSGRVEPIRFDDLVPDASGQISVQKPVCSDKDGYNWAIRAYEGGDLGMEVTGSYETGPDVPVLVSPADNSIVDVNQPIDFTWTEDYAPFGNEMVLGTDPNAVDGVASSGVVMGTSFNFAHPSLNYGTTYYWKVLAFNGSTATPPTTSVASNIFSFTTPQACNNVVQQGGILGGTASVSLGQTSGTFRVAYKTYQVPDDIEVTWPNGPGSTKTASTGCVQTPDPNDVGFSDGTWECSGPLNFSGGSIVTVTVHAGCGNSQTEWAFQVICPGTDPTTICGHI